jgi:hypothetical protein
MTTKEIYGKEMPNESEEPKFDNGENVEQEQKLSQHDSGELIDKDELIENEDRITNEGEDMTTHHTTTDMRNDITVGETMGRNNSTLPATQSDAMNEFGPYMNNLQYLEDQISLFNKIVLLNKDKNKLTNDFDNATGEYYDENYNRLSKEQHERLIKGRIEKTEKKVTKLRERIQIKLAVTTKVPRLEQLVTALKLDEFEKLVLLNLLKYILMPSAGGDVVVGQTIGNAIESFATSLEDKMLARKYFYKMSRLIKEEILCISQNDFMEDLTNCSIDLDRRMFDFLVGLDTEFSEVVGIMISIQI